MLTWPCPEQAADHAYDPRPVVVGHQEQLSLGHGVEAESVEPDDARQVAPEHGARHLLPAAVALEDGRDQVHVVLRLAGSHLVETDAAFLRDPACVDGVHRAGQEPLEVSLEHRHREGGKRLGGDLPAVLDGHLRKPSFEALRLEPPELLRQREVRSEPLAQLRVHRRDIDRVAGHPVPQVLAHLARDAHRHLLLGLGGRGGEVRRENHVVESPEREVLRRRLLLVHVESRRGQRAPSGGASPGPSRRRCRRARS